MKRILLAAALAAAPLAASASTVFEATPTDLGGAFDIFFPTGSSLAPAPQSDYVGNVFGGPGFAISGPENFSGKLADGGRMSGLSFDIYQPTTPQLFEGCNTACVDSAFKLTLKLGGLELGNFTFTPGFDLVQTFTVVLSSSAGSTSTTSTFGAMTTVLLWVSPAFSTSSS